jgi:hypothetical protein
MALISSASATSTSSTSVNGANYRGSFAIMTSLFFLWSFMTVFNDILIPRFTGSDATIWRVNPLHEPSVIQ